jgi:hypothetical protein
MVASSYSMNVMDPRRRKAGLKNEENDLVVHKAQLFIDERNLFEAAKVSTHIIGPFLLMLGGWENLKISTTELKGPLRESGLMSWLRSFPHKVKNS